MPSTRLTSASGVPRIGLVGPLPPPAGGMATQCKQLHELLQSEGLQVVLVQTNRPYRPAWIRHMWGVRAIFRLLPYIRALSRMCAKVDVVHVLANSGWAWHLYAAPAILIARWKGVPVIVNYRGGNAERFLSHAPWWVVGNLRSAQRCIVPSGFLQEILRRFDVPAEIIPNGVDLTRFKPRSTTRSTEVMHVIVTRNLEAIYGIDTALRAFKLVAERVQSAMKLTIAGEGPEHRALTSLARELGIEKQVHFAGRLSRDAVADLYRDADVLLNPSTVDNMPNSILEAYASGVAVVSTNVGGIPYIARDGETALLVPPGDSTVMADRLYRALTDHALRQRLVDNGLKEARRYGWEEIRRAWVDLYASLTNLLRGNKVTRHA